VRICDEIPLRHDDLGYQNQSNFTRQQLLANRLSSEAILEETRMHKYEMQPKRPELRSFQLPVEQHAQTVIAMNDEIVNLRKKNSILNSVHSKINSNAIECLANFDSDSTHKNRNEKFIYNNTNEIPIMNGRSESVSINFDEELLDLRKRRTNSKVNNIDKVLNTNNDMDNMQCSDSFLSNIRCNVAKDTNKRLNNINSNNELRYSSTLEEGRFGHNNLNNVHLYDKRYEDVHSNDEGRSINYENGKEKSIVDNGRTFFDANNNPYASSTNGAQVQESIDNHFVLSRQFEMDEQRKLRLGTLNIHYNYNTFLSTVLGGTVNSEQSPVLDMDLSAITQSSAFSLFSNLGRRVLGLRSTRVCENDENFKKACLWLWDTNDESKVDLSWFLSDINKCCSSFKRLSDLIVGFKELETFLLLTFGSVWKNCLLDLVEAMESDNVQTADCAYLRYKFERTCLQFGQQLRRASTDVTANFASFWVLFFKEMMRGFILTVTFQEQEKWRCLVCLDKVRRVKDSVVLSNVSISGLQSAGTVSTVVANSKQVCVKYLKNALNIINPLTNSITENCKKFDCPRHHNEAFNMSKKQILAALDSAQGDNSIIKLAVNADSRFK
jgi:hypothetical protein